MWCHAFLLRLAGVGLGAGLNGLLLADGVGHGERGQAGLKGGRTRALFYNIKDPKQASAKGEKRDLKSEEKNRTRSFLYIVRRSPLIK